MAHENLILTSYYTSRKDPQRHGFVSVNDYQYIKPWYDSMRQLGLSGIVFFDSLSPEFIAEYTTEKIRFEQVDLTKYERKSLNDVRFYVYKDFLTACANDNCLPEKVFFTDVSDVRVVKNPFELACSPETLYCGSDERVLLKNNQYLMNALVSPLRASIEDAQLHKALQLPVVNAGIVGGYTVTAIRLLERMCTLFDRLPLHVNSNMIVLNVSVWNHEDWIVKFGDPISSEFKKYQNNRADVWFIHK